MDCSYSSFSDGGNAYKKIITDYESLLILEKILDNSNGKSYIKLVKEISENYELRKTPSKFFIVEARQLKKRNDKAKACLESVMKNSSLYNESKLKKFESIIKNSQNRASVAKQLLELLDEKDFEKTFYKIQVFYLFSYINTDAGTKDLN